MSLRERILAVLQRVNDGEVPLGAYSFLLPRGYVERKVREQGCGIFHFEHPYFAEMKRVDVWLQEGVEGGQRFIVRRLSTPIGTLEERILFDPVYGSRWTKEFLVKTVKDYQVLQYVVENIVYHPNYEFLQQMENDLGDDGIVLANVDRTPFQKLLLDWVGPEHLFVHFFDAPEVVEELLALMTARAEEAYRIAADSPVGVVHTWDNVTEDFTTPYFFEKYCLPFYEQIGTLLHHKGKMFMVHMDGKLRNIRGLVARAPIDIIESFSLPDAGGNLSIEEAQSSWPDKTIIANLPAWLCFREGEFIEKYLRELLQRVDRKRFMFCVSEDLPHDRWQETLESVARILAERTGEHDS